MKKKLKKILRKVKKVYKKNKLEIQTAAVVLVLGLILLMLFVTFIYNINLKQYNNDIFTLNYDKSWKIINKTTNTVNLKHKSKSKIYIEIMDLKEDYKYLETSDLIDELLYNIGLQNKEYNLLQRQKSTITKHNYEGYKVLYEKEDFQALVVIAKKSNQVMLMTYEATNDYFDILLDSVENIIYNFEINEKTYLINDYIKIKTGKIFWKKNNEISENIQDNKTYKIADNNYSVELSIPANFKLNSFNSLTGNYHYDKLEKGSINLNASIHNKNIYEYLEQSNLSGTLYSDFKKERENNKDYTKFKETLSELDNKDYLSYLYKVTYELVKTKEQKEIYYIISEIDKNHILLLKLNSTDNVIPKDLITKITFKNVKNYSSNITKNKVLKRFNSKDKYDEITLNLKNTYKEIDINSNMYISRYFGKNYNSLNDVYEYNIKYYLSDINYSLEKALESIVILPDRGPYQDLVSEGSIILNDKEYLMYKCGYTEFGKGYLSNKDENTYYVNKKILLYQLPTGGYLTIEIDGNGVEITQEVLNDLTDVDIMETEYK